MTTAHEPRRGPGTHLSAEDLSALAEGGQPSAAGAAEHVLGCAACRGEVDAISALLAQFEDWDVPAIPQNVAIRVDAALARESAARAKSSGHPAAAAAASREPAPTPSGSSAGHPRRRRWMPTRGLGWTLATLVVVGGGLGIAVQLGTSDSQSTNASSGSATSQGPLKQSPDYGPYANSNGEAGGAAPMNPAAPNSQLALWTKQTLARSESTFSAASGSSCESDPAYAGRQLLATADGPYNGFASTLLVYANPIEVSTVLAVIYATPCTTTDYHVLARGVVTR